MNQIEHKLYFGLNIDGKPKIVPDEVEYILSQCLTITANGYTLQHCTRYGEGKPEKTIVMILTVSDAHAHHVEESLRTICQAYCDLYQQDCVVWTKTNIEAEFVKE